MEDRREVPMPILRQCIEELIRETPADLLSRFVSIINSSFFILFGILSVNSGVAVQVLDYGIKMFKITGKLMTRRNTNHHWDILVDLWQ